MTPPARDSVAKRARDCPDLTDDDSMTDPSDVGLHSEIQSDNQNSETCNTVRHKRTDRPPSRYCNCCVSHTDQEWRRKSCA